MEIQETVILTESLIPAVIGGTLGLLAIFGVQELLKETSVAFKRNIKA